MIKGACGMSDYFELIIYAGLGVFV